MEELIPAMEGQPYEGILSSMDSDYSQMRTISRNLLRQPKLFCRILSNWIDRGWHKKHWHESRQKFMEYSSLKEFMEHTGVGGLGMLPHREGKDFEMIVRAGIPGAQKIWTLWMEQEHQEGRGLAGHGNGFGEENSRNRGSDTTSASSRGSEYIVSRLIRDANDESKPASTRQELQGLLEEVRGVGVEKPRSVHSAALAAGYRKKKQPVDHVRTNLSKCSDAERRQIFEELAATYVPDEAMYQ